jgi:hypothetical protein
MKGVVRRVFANNIDAQVDDYIGSVIKWLEGYYSHPINDESAFGVNTRFESNYAATLGETIPYREYLDDSLFGGKQLIRTIIHNNDDWVVIIQVVDDLSFEFSQSRKTRSMIVTTIVENDLLGVQLALSV